MPFFSKSETPLESPRFLPHRFEARAAAVVFIHGFHGDLRSTWASFPDYLIADPSLSEWDVVSIGYTTNLRIDLARVSSAAPPLDRLALLLSTAIRNQLSDDSRVAIIAHGMGGLIAQRALLDDQALASRTSHVVLFGTGWQPGARKTRYAPMTCIPPHKRKL